MHTIVLDCVLVDLEPDHIKPGQQLNPGHQRHHLNHTFRFKNTDRNEKIIEIEAGIRPTV